MMRSLAPLSAKLLIVSFLASFSSAEAATTPMIVHCVRTAISNLHLTNADAAVLCQGASSYGPVNCFQAAIVRYPLLGPQGAASMCQQAVSLAPLTCVALILDQDSLAINEAAAACKGAT